METQRLKHGVSPVGIRIGLNGEDRAIKAIVTSIGESTTELCKWALERNGFEVTVLQNPSSLARKLKAIYEIQEDFLRVDADVIVNRNLTPGLLMELKQNKNIWWWQFITFDWFKMDTNHTMAFIMTEALPALRANIGKFLLDKRPETQVSRIKELHNPRRMATYEDKIVGVHGYGVRDMKAVKRLKASRGQSHLYDFELAERMYQL